KLLKYINSFAFDVPNEISSIRQAIMLIGMNETKKWLQVLLLYDMGDDENAGRTKVLLDASLVRAKFCELLAERQNEERTDEYFLVGMFSLIDRIMQRPWDYLLDHLPLNSVVKDTIRGIETRLTPYLKIASALESFDLEAVEELVKHFDLSIGEVSKLSVEVQRWIHRFDALNI